MRRVLSTLGLTVVISALLGGIAAADHVRAIADVSVSHAEKVEKGYLLNVTLRGSDGKPLNNATVRFYETVQIFGPREMLIATATTNGQGAAAVPFLPAKLGGHEIVVRFAGREHVGATVAKHTFEATVAAAPYRQPVPPLAAFSARVPYGVGLVVLAVWGLIAFALFGTVRGVLKGGRDRAIRRDTA